MYPTLLNKSQGKVSVLPQYLLSSQGAEFEEFDAVSEWTVDLGSAADNATPGEYRSGASSIKMTATAGGSSRMIKTISGTTFTGGTRIKLYVYLYTADFANLERIYVSFAAAGWANYVQAAFIYNEQNFHAGWNVLDCPINRVVAYGTGWSTTFTILRVWLIAKAGLDCNASVDSLVVNVVGVPAAMITFDDGLSTVYSAGYAYMKTKRAKGTFFIDTSRPGTGGGNVTVAMLQEMDAAGWSIANHSDSINPITGMSQADAQSHIAAAKTALDGWGLTRASKHFAYPSGAWDDVTIAALTAEGFYTGRTIRQNRYPSFDSYADDLLSYKIYTYPGSAWSTMKIGMLGKAQKWTLIKLKTGHLGEFLMESSKVDTWEFIRRQSE